MKLLMMQQLRIISIHALREEGDGLVIVGGFGILQFLSTPSVRRATPEERALKILQTNFYPRPP